MKLVRIALIVGMCIAWSSTLALGADEVSPNFEKHKILQQTSVGTWKIKGDSKGEEVVGEMKGRWAAGKSCVIFSGTFGAPGSEEQTSFSGVVGWDEAAGKIREQIYSSDGGVGTAFFEVKDKALMGKREGINADGVKYTLELHFVLGKGGWVGQPCKEVDANGKVIAEHGEWVFTRVKRAQGKKKLPPQPQTVEKKDD